MIKLIALDVDGCLTDGKIIYTEKGELIKEFNVKDGLGIRMWQELGGKVAIITGKESPIVLHRAKELRISLVYQGIKDKGAVLHEIAQKEGLDLNEIAVIGDDLNDLKMFAICGKSYCPSDAATTIQERVDHKLCQKGGTGVVREMIEHILTHEGRMEQFIAFWE